MFGSNNISATNSFHSGSANGLLFTLFLNFQSFHFWHSGLSGLGICRISPRSSLFLSSPVVFFLFGGVEVYTGGFEQKSDKEHLHSSLSFPFSRKHFEREHTHTHYHHPKRSVCVSYYLRSFLLSFFFIASQPAALHRHLFSSFPTANHRCIIPLPLGNVSSSVTLLFFLLA